LESASGGLFLYAGLTLTCKENSASFSYHQTGARLIKDGKEYLIPREYQHSQARKAKLDYNGMMIPEDEDVL